MKYLKNLVKKYTDYLMVLIASFFLSFPYAIEICSGYLNYYNFDLQEFLLWHYSSINGLIPYVDIFYPYGLLSYFKHNNAIFALINYLIVPFLFTATYYIFKKVFKEKISLFFSLSLFYLFILIIVGFQAFARYGLLTIIPLLFSYIFYLKGKKGKISLIVIGLTIGLFSTFINDQGIYLIVSFILLFILSKIFQSRSSLIEIIKEFIFVVLGFSIGLIPIFLILRNNGGLHIFLSYFTDVGNIVVVAKTPFLTFIDSPANIFTITILYFSMLYNFIRLAFLRQKITLSSIFQISLIFTILLLEQKSIIRSIDRQIVFVSFLLLMLIVYEFVNRKFIYIVFISLTAILYGFYVQRPLINLSSLPNNYNHLMTNKCFDSNLQFFTAKNQSYVKIINLLRQKQDFNGKVFAFPTGDSAFYVMLNQKPPFYNSIFEGASYQNQNSAIKYIEDNEIKYVILNTDKSSLQDAVPDYVRQSFLFGYIVNNYKPFTMIGDHMILKKDIVNDFFSSKTLRQAGDYEKYLLDVYLFKIPYSEGLYKYSYLKNNNKVIIEGNNIQAINSYLENNIFYSKNKVFVLEPNTSNNSQSLSFIKLQIKNGNSTIIYYNLCRKNEACVFDLARIPLFYEERIITEVIINKEFSGTLKIFDLEYPGNLW